MRRFAATALLFILLASALQGCLLTRVLETRGQLCDDQPSRIVVARAPGKGLRVVFEKPTLTDRDVIWIVGYEPTQVTGTGAVRQFTYEALPLHRPLDRSAGLVAELSFERLDGEYRLAEVAIPEKFSAVLSPALLEDVVRVACKAQIGIVPPTTSFDLASLDRSTLPTRDDLTRLLGPPPASMGASDEVSYQYCLAPCDASSAMAANVKVSFGNRGEMQRVDASYFRYFVAIDLVSSRATARVELR
ncbi:hypothetical protein [Usitatibacter palustris]|uniref:Lipoprotein n=1 Tax=Usitatibacter palustris TaxID=2732487 RepID=A0A6M4H9H0_9PROT|nr:hypothetical protein [Usitatibacter palustris]QJR16211.1 hypothetical protein DSM104440_03040 [Usitatibacter palustris]